MRKYLLLLFVISISVFTNGICDAMKIEGGKLVDVVVADSGSSDSTLVTVLRNGWLAEGPNSFDLDQQGNVYILDQISGRVSKFNKDGKWLSALAVTTDTFFLGKTNRFKDLAVDTSGNIYVNRGILNKFSPEGELLCRKPSPDDIKSRVVQPVFRYILVDRDGKLYNFGDRKFLGGITIYDSKCRLEGVLGEHSDYYDIGIVQRDIGNDIYYREGKYMMRERLKEFIPGGKSKSMVDKVAILPEYLRLYEYTEDKEREADWIPPPVWFIGFDKDSCFYFRETEYWYNSRYTPFCLVHRILKYRLEKKELIQAGQVEITFERGQEECSDKELFDFTKQFIVTGEGIIYFLHGTVDKIKVSKITME
ncbi:MAG: hypothetical protein ABII96_11270 [Candidatus Zixiibacteriota bacterium]